MSNNKAKQKVNNPKKDPWLKLLSQTVFKHWLALMFTIVVFIVFRMPHLSDLTVVIIQLKYHTLVMTVFYATIVVLALMIGYSYLFLEKKDDEINTKQSVSPPCLDVTKETSENTEKEAPKKGSSLKTLIKGMNLKDSKEQQIEATSNSPTNIDKGIESKSNLIEFEETDKQYMERIFPKLLATFMILSIAFSVNTTIDELYLNPFVAHYFIWIIATVFVIFTNNKWIKHIKKAIGWNDTSGIIPSAIVIMMVAAIIILGVLNEFGTKGDIQRLFVSMVCLAILFFTLTVSYNTKILKIKERFATPVAYTLIAMALLCYVLLIFWPSNSTLKSLTPMVIFMVCLIGFYTIFTVLRYAGFRTGYPVFGGLFFAAIIFTIINAKNEDFKHYEVTSVKSTIEPDNRMDLNTYIDAWIDRRKEAIAASTDTEPFPIIMVSSEGGGSRAGHWAMLVHSYLYEHSEDYFKNYLFSITGASGGSVGNNMFYVQAYENKENYKAQLFKTCSTNDNTSNGDYKPLYKASEFYNNDYISSSLAGLLGRDLIASVFNVNKYDDRGKITEQEWENEFDKLFDKGLLAKSYLDIMPKKDDDFIPPLLVTTTTHVQSGKLYIMSPVKFQSKTKNEIEFQDLIPQYQEVYPGRMLKRSSAMLLTARFPYISPNGRITGIGQFGDGGYYDNIGGVITSRLERALIEKLSTIDSLQNKYSVRHLIIKNDTSKHYEESGEDECTCKPEKITYNSQLLTPALMVVNATFAPADEFVDSYPKDFRVESKRTLIPIKDSDTAKPKCERMFRPLIPLGRYMSLDAVRSLEARLEDKKVERQLRKLINIYEEPK